ncbi:MAG: acetyltransferase, ribosomal protein N-acetylase [Ilumatobacteraceae bacterium]|nr:acetyltransferase, ribosomal protein N-acetylase [Ilumatobacteraceae bacterium]
MHLDAFLARIDDLAPGYGYDAAARFDRMPVYHRLAITRWLADALEQPTDLDVIRQFATLGDAQRWLETAVAGGEPLRATARPASAASRGASTRVRLRPVLDDDLLAIYLASFDPATSGAWRYRGRTLPTDEFVATLAEGVRAQYVVELTSTGAAVGLVSAYDHNGAGLHCKVAFLRIGARQPGDAGATFEGMLLFLTHLFATFPYRKVFAEVPAYNMGPFEPGLAQEEGILRDYLFHEGRRVDLHIVSFRRDQWVQVHEASGW